MSNNKKHNQHKNVIDKFKGLRHMLDYATFREKIAPISKKINIKLEEKNKNYIGIIFPEINAWSKRFINCNFTSSDLSKVIFDQNVFFNCDFSNVIFSEGTFRNCYFYNCTFANADLKRANLYNSTFVKCSFVGTIVTEISFESYLDNQCSEEFDELYEWSINDGNWDMDAWYNKRSNNFNKLNGIKNNGVASQQLSFYTKDGKQNGFLSGPYDANYLYEETNTPMPYDYMGIPGFYYCNFVNMDFSKTNLSEVFIEYSNFSSSILNNSTAVNQSECSYGLHQNFKDCVFSACEMTPELQFEIAAIQTDAVDLCFELKPHADNNFLYWLSNVYKTAAFNCDDEYDIEILSTMSDVFYFLYDNKLNENDAEKYQTALKILLNWDSATEKYNTYIDDYNEHKKTWNNRQHLLALNTAIADFTSKFYFDMTNSIMKEILQYEDEDGKYYDVSHFEINTDEKIKLIASDIYSWITQMLAPESKYNLYYVLHNRFFGKSNLDEKYFWRSIKEIYKYSGSTSKIEELDKEKLELFGKISLSNTNKKYIRNDINDSLIQSEEIHNNNRHNGFSQAEISFGNILAERNEYNEIKLAKTFDETITSDYNEFIEPTLLNLPAVNYNDRESVFYSWFLLNKHYAWKIEDLKQAFTDYFICNFSDENDANKFYNMDEETKQKFIETMHKTEYDNFMALVDKELKRVQKNNDDTINTILTDNGYIAETTLKLVNDDNLRIVLEGESDILEFNFTNFWELLTRIPYYVIETSCKYIVPFPNKATKRYSDNEEYAVEIDAIVEDANDNCLEYVELFDN